MTTSPSFTPVISERLQLKLLLRQQQLLEEEAQRDKTRAEAEQQESLRRAKASAKKRSGNAQRVLPNDSKRTKNGASTPVSESTSIQCTAPASLVHSELSPLFNDTSSSIRDPESSPLGASVGELCRSEDRQILPTVSLISPLGVVHSSDYDTGSDFPAKAFVIGDLVRVAIHKVGKKEMEGGAGRVVGRQWNDEKNEILYDVQYILRKRTEETIPARHVEPEGLSLTNDRSFHAALSVQDALLGASSSTGNWVRRSVRHAGTDQLSRPNVRDLINRLERDDPNDAEMVVLRLKNWLEADTNSQVLTRVFELVAKSKTVQALYVQNMEKAMDDERLRLLVKALIQNQRVWALNVGENFKVTRNGWERFAEDLSKTGVTHLYAGSESTVYGELKVRMRDTVRDNRVKHDLHIVKWNLNVIWQIGQMWWNPRNSKIVQAYKRDERENGEGEMGEFFQTEDRVVFKRDVHGAPEWTFGTIVEVGEGSECLVELSTSEGRIWLDLLDPKLSCSSKHELVLAEDDDGMMWPTMQFIESQVLVRIRKDPNQTDRLRFVVSQGSHKTMPFFVDDMVPQRSAEWLETVELVKHVLCK